MVDMNSNRTLRSVRPLIRDEAERLLRTAQGPLHVSKIADEVLQRLGLNGQVTTKTVNTTLHDDPLRRFKRVGRAVWSLSPTPQSGNS
jgi:hypothetical protein